MLLCKPVRSPQSSVNNPGPDTASELAGEHDYQRQQENNEVGDGLHTLAHTLYDMGVVWIDTGVHTRQTKCHAKELHGHQYQNEKHRHQLDTKHQIKCGQD